MACDALPEYMDGKEQASLTSTFLRGVFQLRGYFGFSADFQKNTPLKKARKIGSWAFSVIKALIKLN